MNIKTRSEYTWSEVLDALKRRKHHTRKRKVFENPIVSVPTEYLDYVDKSSFRHVSKKAKTELGNECERLEQLTCKIV